MKKLISLLSLFCITGKICATPTHSPIAMRLIKQRMEKGEMLEAQQAIEQPSARVEDAPNMGVQEQIQPVQQAAPAVAIQEEKPQVLHIFCHECLETLSPANSELHATLSSQKQMDALSRILKRHMHKHCKPF